MAWFLLLRNSIAPNDGRYQAKLPIKPLRMCARAWPAAFLFLVTVVGDRIDAHGWDCGRHDIQRAGPRTADVNIRIHGLLCSVDARLPDSCSGRAAGAREGRTQVRLHQAHRHGAARHRQGARLLRGRRPLRHARTAGELEGAARPRHQRRAGWCPHARRPAVGRHDRLRHQGRYRHPLLDGS